MHRNRHTYKGQELEDGGEDEEHNEDDAGHDDIGEHGVAPGAVVHGRAREGARGHDRGRDGAQEVAKPQRNHLQRNIPIQHSTVLYCTYGSAAEREKEPVVTVEEEREPRRLPNPQSDHLHSDAGQSD